MRLNPRPAVARRPGTRTSRHVRAGRARERCWRRRDAMRYSAIRVRMRSLTPLVVAGLSFAYFLTFPLAIGGADESHLLYGARRILNGEVIYRDFFEILTPLAFYLFAAIYRIAGTTLAGRAGGHGDHQCGRLRAPVPPDASVSGLAEATLANAASSRASASRRGRTRARTGSRRCSGSSSPAVTLASTGGRASRVRPLAAGIVAGVAVCVQQQRGVLLAAWLPLALWGALPLARARQALAKAGRARSRGALPAGCGPGRGARARGLDVVAGCASSTRSTSST